MTESIDRKTFADMYDQKAPWDIPAPQPAFVEVADRVVGSLLDAGCGTGENSLFFAGGGNSVTGIDFVEEAIRRARAKATERHVEANFLVMDALALDTLPQVFDNAIDSGLFHTFSDEDRTKYVAGLSSVVRPGGRLFLMCFSEEEPAGAGPRRVSQAELQAALSPYWTIESITPARFQTIPEFAPQFTSGGPKAWFVEAVRNDKAASV